MAAGGSKRCPSGYTMVNGECVDSSGKALTYPYISPKGAFYKDSKSMISGCADNPNKPECKEMVDKLTPEQRKKIGLQENFKQKKGGTTMIKKKLGGAVAKKKMATGGTKKSAKKPCPPFCGESAKEKFSTKSSKIAAGIMGAASAAMAGTGIAKRMRGIKAEQEKAKKEGKPITRNEAKKKYLGKEAKGGTTKKYVAGGMTTAWPGKPKRASSGYKKGGKWKVDKSCRGKNCMNHG